MDTTHPHRDEFADTMVASIHAMAAVDLDTLRRASTRTRSTARRVAEPPATRGRGPEAFLATAHWLTTAFTDLAFDIDTRRGRGGPGGHPRHHVRSAHRRLRRLDAGGTRREGVRSDRRTFAVRQAHFGRMRDGLVVEHWAVRDDQGMALQLGWVPPSPWYLLRCAVATARARRAASR